MSASHAWRKAAQRWNARSPRSSSSRTGRVEKVQGWLVLGEVVAVYIDKSLIKDGVYQTALANPILRSGRGGDYVEVTQDRVFEMERPPGSSHPAFHGS